MNLHNNTETFKQAITFTSQTKGLSEIYIEKDYWVTYVLHKIFNSSLKEAVIFKGGTALAKCYGIIERFSEDIDLVLFRTGNESGNQLKTKLKSISELISSDIPEIHREGITNKLGMIRKTAHNYPKLFDGIFGQVRNDIILETGWLGSFEPFEERPINSYIYEVLKQNNQEELIEEFGLSPFTVTALSPTRTICEKIMSLVRFSHTENPITDLNNKIRHLYDLHQLLQNTDLNKFFESADFNTMLLKVANEDKQSFKNNNEWLKIHPKEALIFSEVENTWKLLRNTYQTTFSTLVFGEIPDENSILNTLHKIKERIEKVNWEIK